MPRPLAALLGSLVALLLAAAPTHAQVEKHRDPAKDVKQWDATREWSPKKQSKLPDVVKVRTEHGRKLVTQTITLRKLGPAFVVSSQLVAQGQEHRVSLLWMRNDGNTYLMTTPTGQIECPSLRGRASQRKDELSFSFKRSCLENPRWIEMGSSVAVQPREGRILVDLTHRKGVARNALPLESELPLGKRLKRS